MGYKIIVDTDYILDISKKISDTSSKIINSINSLQKIGVDLGSNILDPNMKNFNNNFSSYLIKLNDLTSYYNNVSNTINDLAREYDSIDNSKALDMKKYFNQEEGDN